MTETINTEAVITAPELPKIKIKMTPEQILAEIKTYMDNADKSLQKIDESLQKVQEQLSNLQQMKLMISGQKALVIDLYSKMVEEEKGVTNG